MSFRFATAVALFAAAPALAQAPAAPNPADDNASLTIDADTIEGVSDIEVTARGNAEIRRGELRIFGDLLRYNREFGRVEGEGGVRMQNGPDRFFGPRLQYNTQDDTGVFESPAFLLQRNQEARGTAERLEFLGRDKFRLFNTSYTTCRPGQEDWQLQTAELELDYENDEGRARSPRLRFFDVPILGAPYASFPLENRRRSGVLAPYYSQTSTRGLEFGLPYYWNIAPEYDLTLVPVYMRKRGEQLKSEFRYLSRSYSGELKYEYMPEDAVRNETRQGVSWQHGQTFRPGLTGNVDYNKVSDDAYFVDLASQVRQVSLRNLPQDAYVTYGGALGRAPIGAQVRVQRYQTLQDPNEPITPPYHRLPQVNLSGSYNDFAGFLDTSLPAEYVRFTHVTMVEGQRVSANPLFSAPRLAPGWFVIPKLGVRAMRYDLDQTGMGQPTTPAATIPWFSLDSGLVFEREGRYFGETLTNTLEPRLFYVRAPFRDQDPIPIFDTALADFNYAQLFSENRFVGGDRFGDANQLTVAFTSRFLQRDGREALRATIGQRYYFEEERVGLTPTSTLRTSNASDVLASIGGRLYRYWTFDATTQFSVREERGQRFTTGVRYQPEPAKVLNMSYRYDRNALRQIDVSTQWPVTAGWYGVARYNYSFLDNRLLEGLAGVEYNAGCWVFRGVVQRLQASSQVASIGLFFQLEFNGVGQVGTDDVVALLRRSVPGYSVTNPRDPTLSPSGQTPRLPFEQVY